MTLFVIGQRLKTSMTTGSRISTSMPGPQYPDPSEVAVQKFTSTTIKAGKVPITLEAMVSLLHAQGESLKHIYEKLN